jgi:tetratricopeptide (TPR) repeat protein
MILTGILALAAGVSSLMAQAQPKAPAQAQPKVPAQAQPKEEIEALQAVFNAQNNPDLLIKNAEDALAKFADTDFKDTLLFFEARAYQQKGDLDKAQLSAERVIEVNPKYFQATLMMAELLAQRTRENDLDKEEKLTRADKFANDTIAMLKDIPKPNPGLTDADWEDAKKDLVAEAHNAIGLGALTRKKYDVAISEFKTAVDGAAHPEPAYQVRLASALQSAGKNDEAIALCEKIMADPQVHPQIRQVAQAVRAASIQAGGKPTTPPAVPAPPPPAEKKQ